MRNLIFDIIERLTIIDLFINSLFTDNTTRYAHHVYTSNYSSVDLDVGIILHKIQIPAFFEQNIPTLLVDSENILFLGKGDFEFLASLSEKITSTCQNYEPWIVVVVDSYVNEIELDIIFGAFEVKLHLFLIILYPNEVLKEDETMPSSMVASFHNPFEMDENGIFSGRKYHFNLTKATTVEVVGKIKMASAYFSNNLNGYPVNIITFCLPYLLYPCTSPFKNQIHVQIVEEIAELMNWTPVITVAKGADHNISNDVTSKNPLSSLGHKRSMFDLYLFRYLQMDLKPSDCFLYMFSEEICPMGFKVFEPRWKNLRTIFDTITWVLIVFAVLTIISFFRIVSRVRSLRGLSTLKLIQSILSVTAINRKSLVCSLQILWPFWIVFTIIITNAFMSSMGMKFTFQSYSRPIKTYADILKSNTPVVDEFNVLSRDHLSDVAQLYEHVIPTECCYNLFFNDSISSDSVFFSSSRTQTIIHTFFKSFWTSPFYMLHESCWRFNAGYVMHNKFPAMKGVMKSIARLRESGFLSRIEASNSHFEAINLFKYVNSESGQFSKFTKMYKNTKIYFNLKALNLNDFYLAFMILALGQCLSTIVFACELIILKLHH